jgi:hypothetical protein
MFRIRRPGGSVLIAEFRPPASRIGRSLIKTLTGHNAMAENRVDLLEPMLRDAGFEALRTAELRPWITFIQAQKPTSSLAARVIEVPGSMHESGSSRRAGERTVSDALRRRPGSGRRSTGLADETAQNNRETAAELLVGWDPSGVDRRVGDVRVARPG